MKKLQNSLYITKQGAYLHKERETLVIEVEKEKVMQVPIHAIQAIYCFGNVMVSPFLMGFCGENGVHLAFCTEYGRFLGRLQGKQSGNILLRQAQYKVAEMQPEPIARNIIAAKISNSRAVLYRRLRNHGDNEAVEQAIKQLHSSLRRLERMESLDQIRGIEGEAAATYFGVFNQLIQPSVQADFQFNGRNRRPPRDPINALLSFLYSVVGNDISAALQGVGLDPQMGFLHQTRPGRDSLAQDVLEEFRAWWVDRLVLSLINRKQLKAKDFIIEASGAITLKDDARKVVLVALQNRKQETIKHPFLNEDVPIGLLPHVQALLLARHLRGDLAEYPPFVPR
ncbi:MAG: subtype I-C CRISPR-associated endonuclease Cas1 [Piscirickettsiaceae bacterium CG_4_10_14_3_um_filter_44_349]|nr:type I-C CRISPR-associated endonuclease Cas1 [Thiomicrospira sp.]PIU39528.1 MAG: subtype I-C CRISPR-associated endonuclease Cas1 [Piscirickettsiaceae bacterium CG07_land_8_20_14_0_80_44_28]PIX77961.1 MAG: subtype I-C CRISPR-associated endonuclease Cas1 [Piscirickettsiaceae bacterium CG_4_10_14_3_um_filter_44_349]PIY76689.1 MAG: subtype I-C CRISPR-associated endonuclease Cas1 [Piscirickettsiaceae bacterium CG_4_10_14_0_8_um_filter_44_742]